jgi:hypothetical protein
MEYYLSTMKTDKVLDGVYSIMGYAPYFFGIKNRPHHECERQFHNRLEQP